MTSMGGLKRKSVEFGLREMRRYLKSVIYDSSPEVLHVSGPSLRRIRIFNIWGYAFSHFSI